MILNQARKIFIGITFRGEKISRFSRNSVFRGDLILRMRFEFRNRTQRINFRRLNLDSVIFEQAIGQKLNEVNLGIINHTNNS